MLLNSGQIKEKEKIRNEGKKVEKEEDGKIVDNFFVIFSFIIILVCL